MSDDQNTTDKDFLGYLGRHIVALTGIFLDKSTDPPRRLRFIYGGIIMSFGDAWFFVTAGHALQNLSRAVELGLIEHLSLLDYISYLASHKMPVPFVYEKRFEVAIVNDDITHADFGIYYLREYYCNAMKANEAEPLPERQWLNQPGRLHLKSLSD
jgi:hypothetical protein